MIIGYLSIRLMYIIDDSAVNGAASVLLRAGHANQESRSGDQQVVNRVESLPEALTQLKLRNEKLSA
jgi:hypothetical protein